MSPTKQATSTATKATASTQVTPEVKDGEPVVRTVSKRMPGKGVSFGPVEDIPGATVKTAPDRPAGQPTAAATPTSPPPAAMSASVEQTAPDEPERGPQWSAPEPIRALGDLLPADLDLRVDYSEAKVRESTPQLSASLIDVMARTRSRWASEHFDEIQQMGLGGVHASAFREMLIRLGLKHLGEDPDALHLLPKDKRVKKPS